MWAKLKDSEDFKRPTTIEAGHQSISCTFRGLCIYYIPFAKTANNQDTFLMIHTSGYSYNLGITLVLQRTKILCKMGSFPTQDKDNNYMCQK